MHRVKLWHRCFVFTTVAALLVAGVGSARPAAAAGKKVAYTSCRDNDCDLWTMSLDGSNQRRVIHLQYPQTRPSYTPGGTTIVFESTHAADGAISLYRVREDGTDLRRLTTGANDWTPDVSPDGKLIAYAHTSGSQTDIWVMDMLGNAKRRVLADTANETEPVWSSDSKSIVYVSDRGGSRQIHRAWLNSTRTAVSIYTKLTSAGNNSAPDYLGCGSRGGQRIAFTSDRDGNPEIYQMADNGTDQVRITNNPAVDTNPSWVPQGAPTNQLLVFETNRAEGTRTLWIRTVQRFGSYDSNISGTSQFDLFPDVWGGDVCPFGAEAG